MPIRSSESEKSPRDRILHPLQSASGLHSNAPSMNHGRWHGCHGVRLVRHQVATQRIMVEECGLGRKAIGEAGVWRRRTNPTLPKWQSGVGAKVEDAGERTQRPASAGLKGARTNPTRLQRRPALRERSHGDARTTGVLPAFRRIAAFREVRMSGRSCIYSHWHRSRYPGSRGRSRDERASSTSPRMSAGRAGGPGLSPGKGPRADVAQAPVRRLDAPARRPGLAREPSPSDRPEAGVAACRRGARAAPGPGRLEYLYLDGPG